MKKLFQVCLLCSIIVLSNVSIAEFSDELKVESQNLILNGQGTRKKLVISLYDAALYLSQADTNAENIIQSDQAMAIELQITSGLISSEKMESATRQGLDKSTGGNTASIKEEIESFIDVFRDEISEGDKYRMVYIPNKGTEVSKNGELRAVIQGIDFKRALFGIWLSKSPAQKSLKKALLGK